jgi:hypothetical protein
VSRIVDNTVYKGSDIAILPGGDMKPRMYPRLSIPPRWWRWKTVVKCRLRNLYGAEHINVLELRSYLAMLRWRTRKGALGIRFLHLKDSQVNLAIIAKGRTSARKLAPVLEKASALTLACKLQPLGAYCRTHDNPADDPSRLRRLRSGVT